MKLNLGCGNKILEGYVNIDIRRLDPRVFVADVRDLPYHDDSIDEILAVDVYEHVVPSESQALLTHWVSKLKKGGHLRIHTSYLKGLCEFALKQNTVEGVKEAIRRMYGMDVPGGWQWYRTIGDPLLMKEYLVNAGITGTITFHEEGWLLWVFAVK